MYPFVWGSQGLYSTPIDYARFVALWLDRGVCGRRRLLSEAAVARTLTPVSILTAMGSDIRQPTNFSGLELRYGQMAMLYTPVATATDGAPRVIGHAGSDGTVVWAWPDRDLMVLYFTQSRGTMSYLRLERAIERFLLDPEGHRAAAPDPKRLAPFLGNYVANFGPFHNVEFTVFAQDGVLALDVPGQFATELREPDAEGRWVSVLVDRIAVSFERDEAGAVSGMNFHEADSTFVLPRAGTPDERRRFDAAALGRYLGWYRDPESASEVELILHEGRLAARVAGAAAPVEFDWPDRDGFWHVRLNPTVRIRFDEDLEGRVVSYTVHTPDGSTFVRPRITGRP
jgi:hypothetical protein